jgi:hypothetical protein
MLFHILVIMFQLILQEFTTILPLTLDVLLQHYDSVGAVLTNHFPYKKEYDLGLLLSEIITGYLLEVLGVFTIWVGYVWQKERIIFC